MIQKEDLLITFPSIEEKSNFMIWFKKYGFDSLIKHSNISCISSFEDGETESDIEYSDNYSYIELE